MEKQSPGKIKSETNQWESAKVDFDEAKRLVSPQFMDDGCPEAPLY
tara:strand:+ start:381 stop:518 length:138 start_codon:yes stop_codon:yes gene_type:complete